MLTFDNFTPLWLAVASTKKILSTKPCCSRKAISNKSTFRNDIVFMVILILGDLKAKEHEHNQLSGFGQLITREAVAGWARDRPTQDLKCLSR